MRWTSLARMYLEEYKHSFNARPDPLGRAAAAIGKALMLDPASQFAYYGLASTRFFQKDFDAFRLAAERAVALNPLDGSTKAWMGLLNAYSGDWDRGLSLVEEALRLNPNTYPEPGATCVTLPTNFDPANPPPFQPIP